MYEYWFDADGKMHEIKKMESLYIKNCLKQLKNMLDAWHGIIPEQLTKKELSERNAVGSKAWFVFNGMAYIDAFSGELKRRKDIE